MVKIRSFKGIRPKNELAHRVAALPYDVYNTEEAREEIEKEELSFLQVDTPLATLPVGFDEKDPRVYLRAKENMDRMIKDGIFQQDETANLYLYELEMDGRKQLGLVCCSSVDEYQKDIIKKHEKTRAEKEEDRIRHVDSLDANTGPIFLLYRDQEEIQELIENKYKEEPEIDFVSPDGVGHRVWTIEDQDYVEKILTAFEKVDALYIADGHHRSASAVKVGELRRKENPNYTGQEEFNFFLSILYPQSQVKIFDYNRVVKDLNGLKKDQFLEKIEENFICQELGQEAYKPEAKGYFGMFLDGKWYKLKVKEGIYKEDPISSLDVSILQDFLLNPVLGIQDPRRDNRIDFIGGIRGLKELERRVGLDMEVAFSLYPTSLEELMAVADAGQVMPPKSTWFEPKPRSGLFIHELK